MNYTIYVYVLYNTYVFYNTSKNGGEMVTIRSHLFIAVHYGTLWVEGEVHTDQKHYKSIVKVNKTLHWFLQSLPICRDCESGILFIFSLPN